MSNNLDITINDFEHICRTCLSREDLKPLYEKFSGLTYLIDMFMLCTSVKFTEDDGLPAKICTNCIHDISQAFSFAKRCESTETILQKCVKIKTELANSLSQSHEVESAKEETRVEMKPERIFPDDHRPVDVLGNYEFVTVKQEEDLLVENESAENYDDSAEERYEKNDDEDQSDNPGSINSQIVEESSKDENGSPSGFLKDNQELNTEKGKANKIRSKDFQCKECDRKYTTKMSLQRHSLNHGEKKFFCNVCGKGFVSKSILNSHSKIHTGSYACQECGRGFQFLSSLKNHHLVHAGEKQHVCSVCSKAFTLLSTLKDHMRTHTGEKPYSCKVCSTPFSNSSNLKRHMRMHTGEKPHTCEVCNKTFARSLNLKIHMRIHTGEKPYICGICSKTFKEPGNLKVHMRMHTGSKPYSCEICGKSFSVNTTLTAHKRIHKKKHEQDN